MTKHLIPALTTIAILLFTALPAASHCEIPCGIYDDKMRISLLNEHITTMEKSMAKITELQGEASVNQRVRWVMNKEDHANQFQHIVSQYFLTQRIKPDTKDYGKKLELLHSMMVYAMKCKQTTDMENVKKLKDYVAQFDKLYFAPHN